MSKLPPWAFISITRERAFACGENGQPIPLYGRQFRVEEAEPLMPATIEGITNYLASGLIKVWDLLLPEAGGYFGLDTLEIITKANLLE